jgi:hypothetical protein
MGTAPASADLGDQVVIFSGAKQPTIVRPTGDTYRVLGPAYVSGISFGQAWDSMWSPESGLSEFIIS